MARARQVARILSHPKLGNLIIQAKEQQKNIKKANQSTNLKKKTTFPFFAQTNNRSAQAFIVVRRR